MKITKDTTVSVEYTLKDDTGEILDSSEVMGPLEYIHGYNMIISGLEKALEGKEAGDEFKKTIPPEDAYGEVFEDLIVETDRSQFPPEAQIEVGMDFEAGDGPHSRVVRITKIDGDKITIDANHPLAGETLHFEVKILSVKKTTEEELQSLVQMMSADSCGCGCGCGHEQNEHACGCGCSGCH
ncbi:FKBP-type peptidyl-prolyl cis-trans isomerase [Treponema pedis]|uniref:Peptidyl-prolyl cis-trans isomerase n=2 Tax=Treponema pedis TaxID=409322 RepID=S5ZZK8_9SPIR|nr:peptidylprolyl isomerase [Treponema pedis]AGT43728.1 FKBP-type peptidyl-prolyl cis-trans isomerase [Treponema pedis str. T A4]QOW61255.1 peptidylprolyl isomerase [Treponema pedis]QSI04495.1 peptidylprolyl isomerase [Treponema pedis]